jgi:hypothetical protein
MPFTNPFEAAAAAAHPTLSSSTPPQNVTPIQRKRGRERERDRVSQKAREKKP